eukprot:CAMPEP_0117495032 /NCGR_PEP_ID=MMETSP0784-20121206/19923_1 /TAXON_ID=39447 /ORGANISM="" /LENGTH=540 /DNA_ID=CAMNT_0005289941 /DNA_START=79 /DNA_END=1701 /DNA_ORIENTATION=-
MATTLPDIDTVWVVVAMASMLAVVCLVRCWLRYCHQRGGADPSSDTPNTEAHRGRPIRWFRRWSVEEEHLTINERVLVDEAIPPNPFDSAGESLELEAVRGVESKTVDPEKISQTSCKGGSCSSRLATTASIVARLAGRGPFSIAATDKDASAAHDDRFKVQHRVAAGGSWSHVTPSLKVGDVLTWNMCTHFSASQHDIVFRVVDDKGHVVAGGVHVKAGMSQKHEATRVGETLQFSFDNSYSRFTRKTVSLAYDILRRFPESCCTDDLEDVSSFHSFPSTDGCDLETGQSCVASPSCTQRSKRRNRQNANLVGQYQWLDPLLRSIVDGDTARWGAEDAGTGQDCTPLFVVAGGCPNATAPMQAVLYSQTRGGVDFWFVKPEAKSRDRLEQGTLSKHAFGPFKNTAEFSKCLYAPLARLFEGTTHGDLVYGVDPLRGRAYIEEQDPEGKTRRLLLYFVWQEAWSHPLAWRRYLEGKICYEVQGEFQHAGQSAVRDVGRRTSLRARQFRIDDSNRLWLASLEDEERVNSVLPLDESFQYLA